MVGRRARSAVAHRRGHAGPAADPGRARNRSSHARAAGRCAPGSARNPQRCRSSSMTRPCSRRSLSARTEFLAGQDFDRLQVTVLVEGQGRALAPRQRRGRRACVPGELREARLPGWSRALVRSAAQGTGLPRRSRPADDRRVGQRRDGMVVDAISGAPNGPVEGADVNRVHREAPLHRARAAGVRAAGEPAALHQDLPDEFGRGARGPRRAGVEAAGPQRHVDQPRREPDARRPERRDRAAGDRLHARHCMRRPTFSGAQQPRRRLAAGFAA